MAISGVMAATELADALAASGAVTKITDTQSYSQVIRDALFAKVVVLPFFTGFKARRSKQLPIQEPLLPYLGVYIIGEEMPADGDWNAGDIRFVHDLRVGFQIIIENNDPVASELKLDAAFWAIMNGLWPDPDLMNLINSSLPDNTIIEGVPRGVRRHVWDSIGANQVPIGELEYIATLRYRTEWFPLSFPDLQHIHVETVPLTDQDTVPAADEVQRVISEYEFTASTQFTLNPAQGEKSDGRADRRAGAAQEDDRRAKRMAQREDAKAGAGPRRPTR